MAPVMLLVSTHQQQQATSMIDSTSVLFGLEDEFAVTGLERLSEDDLRVVIRAPGPGGAPPGLWCPSLPRSRSVRWWSGDLHARAGRRAVVAQAAPDLP